MLEGVSKVKRGCAGQLEEDRSPGGHTCRLVFRVEVWWIIIVGNLVLGC